MNVTGMITCLQWEVLSETISVIPILPSDGHIAGLEDAKRNGNGARLPDLDLEPNLIGIAISDTGDVVSDGNNGAVRRTRSVQIRARSNGSKYLSLRFWP